MSDSVFRGLVLLHGIDDRERIYLDSHGVTMPDSVFHGLLLLYSSSTPQAPAAPAPVSLDAAAARDSAGQEENAQDHRSTDSTISTKDVLQQNVVCQIQNLPPTSPDRNHTVAGRFDGIPRSPAQIQPDQVQEEENNNDQPRALPLEPLKEEEILANQVESLALDEVGNENERAVVPAASQTGQPQTPTDSSAFTTLNGEDIVPSVESSAPTTPSSLLEFSSSARSGGGNVQAG